MKMNKPIINSSFLAKLAIIAAIAYQVLLLALILIRPDIQPYWHTLSEWAIGRFGWIMSVAFIISGLSYGFLLLAIRKFRARNLG